MVVSKRNVPGQKGKANRANGGSASATRHASSASPMLKSEVSPATSNSDVSPFQRWLKRLALGATAFVAGMGTAGLVLVVPLPFNFSGMGNSQAKTNDFFSLFQHGLQYSMTRPVNILFMGVDRVPGAQDDPKLRFSGRSDTILVVRFDPKTQAASVLSIPRDTQVQIPQIGLAKINEANAAGGPALARDVVSQTLNQLPLDRYVRVSTEAFRELIDALGGVEVFVPKAMRYTDQTQNLQIDLQPGLQHLNGAQAEQFARFRYDNLGDIGRVQRQQVLLRAIREKLKDPTVLPRIPIAIQVLQKYIDTNLSFDEIASLLQSALKLDQKQIRMVMLPGRFGSATENAESYWLMNADARDRVLRSYFGHTLTDPTLDTPVVPEAPTTLQSLNIAIQNASGNPGVGSWVASQLRADGFGQVYVVEDWPEVLQTSEIIPQQGDVQSAKALQHLLNLGRVDATSTGDIESDLTIRVGEDWARQHTQTPDNPVDSPSF